MARIKGWKKVEDRNDLIAWTNTNKTSYINRPDEHDLRVYKDENMNSWIVTVRTGFGWITIGDESGNTKKTALWVARDYMKNSPDV